ncbi:hypothetical protein Tco_1447344 [Tanacetum coccineum]
MSHADVVSYVPTNPGWECEGIIFSQGSIDGWVELRQQFTTKFSTRRACFKDPTKITKIVRKANETLVAFKERWIVETSFITGVSETVDEMMTRMDDFVRSKESFASMELPKGEASEASIKSAGSVNTKEDRFHRGMKEEAGLTTGTGWQLEMALDSGKLNYLIKDVRQRGRGNAKGMDAGKDKVINMIRSWPNDRKRKSVERDEIG